MPRGRAKDIREEWAKGKLEAGHQRDLAQRLLPSDLQEQLLKAANAEMDLLRQRVREINQALVDLAQQMKEARELQQAARIQVQPAPLQRETVTGTVRTSTPRAYNVRGKGAIEMSRKVRKIAQHIANLQAERAQYITDLGAIVRLKRQLKAGVVSGLLAITARWRNRIDLAGPSPVAKLAASFTPTWVDAAGYELPKEALDHLGRPLPTPPSPIGGKP